MLAASWRELTSSVRCASSAGISRPSFFMARAHRREARYEERTSGPDMTPKQQMRSASLAKSTNSWGVTHRSTGWWGGSGRQLGGVVSDCHHAACRDCMEAYLLGAG